MQHIHLDPLGGAAGDMFVAALLDAFPEHGDAATRVAAALAGLTCRLLAHDDGTLTGSRFAVDRDSVTPSPHDGLAYPHDHRHGAEPHDFAAPAGHTPWREIRLRIAAAGLPLAVARRAAAIFAVLADAEARVHGVAADDVAFHEVGAADSIADIVAAAWVIEAIGPAQWSCGTLPLGSGRVHTAHGVMPVPAPATAILLEGFAVHDDGLPGERVTPTGAAILRHLGCADGPAPAGIMRRSGHGFGTRRLPGTSNCLRVLVLEATATAAAPGPAGEHRSLAVVSFEVDDQSGEDLACGLEHVRATEGVHDVVQLPAFGKKSRFAVHVQVLARPDRLDQVVEACFRETTTIGLRTQLVQGRALPRHFAEATVEGRRVAVKLVDRPGGPSGKAESDALREVAGQAARTGLRRAAEQQVLAVADVALADPQEQERP